MYILGIETSCDETSVAVLDNEKIIANIISSQFFHSQFGGVVPEIASREHLRNLINITNQALINSGISLNDINIIACTSEPGLVGALLIGLNFSKSLAFSLNIPFIPVNHIQAHLYSSLLNRNSVRFPFISLIVSGGHTLLILVENFFNHKLLGNTLDDAAGEAFDKVAKMLGLAYPGGPVIDELSVSGNSGYHKFPVAVTKGNPLDFSFSGIKTSVLYHLKKINYIMNGNDRIRNDICASFQEAVINTLIEKTLKAAALYNIDTIAVSGGVSANSLLKKKFKSLEDSGYNILIPEAILSTDNAAMIAYTGYLKFKYRKETDFLSESLNTKARPRLNTSSF